jgi:hypothetical protein
MDELLWEDACGQAEAIRSKQVSPAELIAAYLDRIERFDPVVRAFVTVDVDAEKAVGPSGGDRRPVRHRPRYRRGRLGASAGGLVRSRRLEPVAGSRVFRPRGRAGLAGAGAPEGPADRRAGPIPKQCPQLTGRRT